MKINDVLVEFATQGELDERNMGQPRVAAAKPEIVSAVDNGKTITVQVRVPDGTTRSMSNSNPALIQQWLNVKYGLRFPANIARKFVGMPASMAEQDIDEDITRRGFLQGAGAAAVAGGAGYKMGQNGASDNGNPYTVDKLSSEDLKAIDTNLTWYAIVRRKGKPSITGGGRNYDAEMEAGTVKDLMKVYGKDFIFSRLKKIQDRVFAMSDQELEREFNRFWTGPADTSKSAYIYNKLLPDYKLNKESVEQGVAESDLNEKSTSQAQFRTMAAAAHNPAFARKVGIDTDVAQEFHGADRGQDYKDLPKKANESELDEGDLDEGWKEKVAAAALAGTMALGSAGAQARITPDAQGNFPSSGKPVATQQATTTAPAIPSTLTKPQAQYDVDTQLLTYKGKQYKWNSDAQATGQGEVVSAPAMSIRSRSMFPTKVELNPNGTYTRASVNEATGRLPDPQNYDSDWDYYNDRDAEEPEDTDSDYENMIDEPSDWFDESRQKVGNMDADAFDDALARMKKLAGAGPLKTVYDPNKRVYKNVPTAQQPAKQPQK